jgi:nucleoside-diphosphate-sugar epimerase
MKVLVTGATGGMGGMVISRLLKEKGIEVIATARSHEKAKSFDFFPSVKFIPYDLNNPEEKNLFTYFDEPDVLIHIAWESLDNYNLKEHTTVYLENHKKFVSNMLRNGLKDFNGIGTCYECGLQEGLLKEDCTTEPTQPYAVAKNLLRKYSQAECERYGAVFKWIRFFYVFGESKGKTRKNLYTMLNEAIKRGEPSFNMSGGEQIRDFSTPQEMAERVVRISLQKKVNGIINCGSGKPVKLKDFIREYLDKNNFKIQLNLGFYPYADYEPMTTWADVTKLNAIMRNDVQ